MWFLPDELGEYVITCAEYCGMNHAYMQGRLRVVPVDEYNAWVNKIDTVKTTDTTKANVKADTVKTDSSKSGSLPNNQTKKDSTKTPQKKDSVKTAPKDSIIRKQKK